MKRTGLYFGSFNPIHIGHMIIANHILQHADMEDIWFVVSPHNPLKQKASLANGYDRLHLVQLAIEDNPNFRVSNIEFSMPQPSYTIDTLTVLSEKYPNRKFVLIMGGDNLSSFTKWKNYEQILEQYEIYVYSRPQSAKSPLEEHPNVHLIEEAPQMGISSTFIRRNIALGYSVRYLIPEPVFEYLKTSHLYREDR